VDFLCINGHFYTLLMAGLLALFACESGGCKCPAD